MAPPIPVYVLAGGLSSRFGSDKARALAAGEPVLRHVVRAVAPRPVVLVVDRPGRHADLDLPGVVGECLDAQPRQGPLGGLCAALHHRRRTGPGWLALLACDVLGFDGRWLDELAAHARPGARAVAFRGERWQPLPGLYHTDLLPEVEAALAEGAGALWRLLETVAATPVPLPANWADATLIHTPADLAQWHARQAEVGAKTRG